MKKKIYFIQPTYMNKDGTLLKGKSLYIHSLALPALSAAIPPDWEKEFCVEYFEDINFDTDSPVVALTSMGYDIVRGMEIAKEFKKRGKLIIFGGYQAHFSSHLLTDLCDSVIHGNPGKKDMKNILSDIEHNNIKRDYHCGIDVNFPFDYSIISRRNIIFTPVLSSIGCLNNCDFCCTAGIYKGRYRLRNLECVIEDLRNINKFSGRAGFVDNNIYNNREYLLRLLKAILKNKIKIKWGAQVTIDIGDDREALNYLYKAGCRVLFIGMETVNQSNLKDVNKNYTVQSYVERIRNIHKAGIKIAGYFMFGLDNDTAETADKLYEFIRDTRIAIPILNILIPAPGTKIFEHLQKEGRLLFTNDDELLRNNSFYNSACNTCFYVPKSMTADEAENAFLKLYGKLATYPQIIWRSIDSNPKVCAVLLKMNLTFRKEYNEMKKSKVKLIAEEEMPLSLSPSGA